MKILKYIPLAFFLIFVLSLVFHYFTLRSFTKLNLAPEINQYYSKEIWKRPDVIKAMDHINSHTIVAIGGSTLIVPGNCEGKYVFPGTFPELLNNEFKKNNLSVLNLGLCGDDSRGALGAVDLILKIKKPKAFLFYLGHSDYSNVSRDLIFPKTALINTDYLLKHVLSFLSLGLKFKIDHFLKNTFEAALIKMYRQTDASLFNRTQYQVYSNLVSDHFEKNVETIIRHCREKKVPLIFMTPVGNLLYPPVAADPYVTSLYKKGLETRNVELLNSALEEDYFGFDQRAKQKASFIVHKQAAKDVLIVDLNEDFLKKETQFYANTFSDIFHFTEDGHKYVFHKIMSADILHLIH